jgi:hypothetical protein
VIFANHGGEPFVLFAAIGGVGALPALLLFVRARVAQLVRRRRRGLEAREAAAVPAPEPSVFPASAKA